MKDLGFDYFLDEKILRDYRRKPLRLRLRWLYEANKLRKHYPKKIIQLQQSFRHPEV